MTTKTFELTWDQVDSIVIDELQDVHERLLSLDRDEGGCYLDPDWELVEAIETVLGYFMSSSEFPEWERNADHRKLAVTTELMGSYDDEE